MLAVSAALLFGASAGADQPRGIHPGTEGRALPAPPTPVDGLRLAILPDRTTGRDWGLSYLETAVDDLNRIRPHAVISIGDMIQGYTRSAARWDREAQEFQTIVQDLTMPFYPLAGNHEVISGTRDRHDATFLRRYQEAFAPLYYAIDFAHATAIVCFSDDPTFEGPGLGLGAAQLEWLRRELDRAARRGEPIIVLTHRPLWRQRNGQWLAIIHPLLVDAGVDAVVAGHFHALQREPDRDGVEYHILGTCGGMIDQQPLAGQLQHLTFLNITPAGECSIYHQPVGMTLPDDFVRSVDQDRVYVLKTKSDVVQFAAPAADPYRSAVDGTVPVKLVNPLDVPVEVTVDLVDEVPRPHLWPGTLWVSRMERDRFNPHVTDVDTRFRLASVPDPVVLEPGGEAVMQIQLRCPKLDAPPAPPEFHFSVAFEDTHGRRVPVVVRRRLPLTRVVHVPSTGATAGWPICAWDFSVFETLEPNPALRMSVEGDKVTLTIDVADDTASGFPGPAEEPSERFRNPMADAVVLEAGVGAGRRLLLIEPFISPDVWEVFEDRPAAPTGLKARITETDAGWQLVLTLPRQLFEGPEGRTAQLNIGVADNDEAYHTQWRWLAPRGFPATLVFLP